MSQRMIRALLCALLVLLTGAMLMACDKNEKPDGETDGVSVTESNSESTSETVSETVSETMSETGSETTSVEEAQRLADEAYLQTVTYLNFELTGEAEPYFVGRWFEKTVQKESHMVTTTDGSHLYFLVEGTTEINVNFTPIHQKVEPYFAYSIDGATPVRQHITEPTVTLPDTDRHTVRIIADGLNEDENKWAQEIGFALKSITAGDGRIAGIKPTGKTIFFYGDSITEGIVSLQYHIDSDGNSATNAYPWHTAAALGATPYYVGYGATGLLATGSFNTMLRAIDYLSARRKVDTSETAAVTPDLIVINHGANDQGQSVDAFEAALRNTIARLQEKYPGVQIVYMVPFLSASSSAVARQAEVIQRVAAEKGMYVVKTKDWDLTYTDGNLHPDVEGAKKAGEKLAEALKGILGEDFFAPTTGRPIRKKNSIRGERDDPVGECFVRKEDLHMNPTSRPLFIVFEGIDGTGKSTQMRRLAERLTAEGIPITLTAEPTDMEEGHYLRRVLAGQVAADNAKIAALFLLDRIGHNVHPTQGIARMLADGKTVLSDRYYYSSMAYQGAGEDFPWVADMNLNCPAVRHPDGCIFLDMEPEDSMARIRARASEGVAELEIYETVAQQTAIRDRFLRAFDYVADRDFVVKVNAAGTVEEVADRVWSAYRVIAARAGLRAPDEKN